MKATHRHAIAAALLALVGGGGLAGLVLSEPAAEQVSADGARAVASGKKLAAPVVRLEAHGVGDEVAGAAASDVPTALGLRAGDVREGTFRFESRLALGSAQGETNAMATVVEGQLTVVCYEAGSDGVLLGERWAATSLALEGQESVSREALARAVATEVLVRLDRRGVIRGLALPSSASSEARNLQRALVASARVVLPAAASARWTATGFDPIGPCEDSYAAAGDDVVTRTRRFLGVAGAPAGTVDVDTEGKVELVLAADGLPAKLQGREVVRLTSRDAGIGMTLTTVSALERTAERTLGRDELGRALAAVEAALGPSAWSVGLAAELDREGAAHVQRPEPRELEALVTLLALAMPDVGDGEVDADAPRLFLELAARFRDDPAAIARAVELARGDRLTSGARATLIDSLGEAGTEAAQRALIALARDPLVQDDVLPNVFLSLAEPTAPLPEVVATLEAGAKSDDPLRREWATQGLGILAGRATDDGLADRLAADLERSLGAGAESDRVLLEALGNAGRVRSVATIVAFTKTPDEELRATAVSALRQLEGEQVDAAIGRGLADPSDLVRREALRTLAARGPTSALAPVATALANDPVEVVRLQALDVLGRWLADALYATETPETTAPAVTADALRAVVQRAAAGDASPDVREAAAALLAGA